MEKKLKHKLVLIIFISLIVGIFIGYVFGLTRDSYKKGNFKHTKTVIQHKMTDGSAMNENTSGHTMEAMMMDMTSSLQGKVGDEFDKTFLSEMIVHHEGAVEMAKKVLQNSKRPELLNLAQEIISAQTKEINTMKSWSSLWFNTITLPVSKTPHNQVACTMDAKMCPDGSAVGRQGPNCEFAPCPSN